ncbi:MAG: PilZ domain-containing protein [Phycisphaeraceae bacterium]|nr:PilZ domain-containing protein [Phycisphaeraceae bacterium]
MISRERRDSARMVLRRPVKVYCPTTGRYIPAVTFNLSSGGTLLQVQSPTSLKPGQRIRIGIGWTPDQAVLQSQQMIDGLVLRSLGHQGQCAAAVRFDTHPRLAMSA